MEQLIEPYIVTYKDLRSGNVEIKDDRYSIASYVLTPARVNTLLACPYVVDDEKTCALYFIEADGIVVGRESYFATRIKAGDDVLESEAASAFEVTESYRRLAVGAEIVMATFYRSTYFIGAGVSSMALPLDRKLKFHVLEFPLLMSFRKFKGLFDKGYLSFLSFFIDLPLMILTKFITWKADRKAKKFRIEKVLTVPEWVDDIVLNDGHKYTEYHDHKWLQWNLDYHFMDYPQNIQSFYCIYEGDEPIGFFMTKERLRAKMGDHLRNVLIGSVVEWGTKDESILSEYDINLISQKYFTKDVNIIETASANLKTVSALKRLGFIKHGNANIVFKDKSRKYKDASDINLWRARLGYGDVILSQ